MRYARSDIQSYQPPGGVCPGHDEGADDEYDGLSVDCPICEPFLKADPLWAGNPHQVPLTEAEQSEVDAQEREAQAVTAHFAASLADAAREQVAKNRAQNPSAGRKPAKTVPAKAPAKRAPRKAAGRPSSS
jgi:hypothetical protein